MDASQASPSTRVPCAAALDAHAQAALHSALTVTAVQEPPVAASSEGRAKGNGSILDDSDPVAASLAHEVISSATADLKTSTAHAVVTRQSVRPRSADRDAVQADSTVEAPAFAMAVSSAQAMPVLAHTEQEDECEQDDPMHVSSGPSGTQITASPTRDALQDEPVLKKQQKMSVPFTS